MSRKSDDRFKKETKVLISHSNTLLELSEDIDELNQNLDQSIYNSEILLKSLNIDLPKCEVSKFKTYQKKAHLNVHKTWSDLMAEAEEVDDDDVNISMLLSEEEIQRVENSLKQLNGDFKDLHRLDKIDWSIAGSIGMISALVDIFLVQMPKRPGYLGEEAIKGGSLSNYIKEILTNSFTQQEIRELEKNNWVPFDAAHSKTLNETVEGLGPRTHRYQTLGHDPILGFIFGVRDILYSEMTAIDKNGKLIIQSIDSKDKNIFGMRLFEAVVRVFGHLKSDVSTKSGLPVPLMPLIQFIQLGEFGEQKYTIGEISRTMYRSGYDFAHFLSMSIPVLIIEVLVRILYLIKNLQGGKSLLESIPFDTRNNKKPKLQTMLFTAHLLATTANTCKVYLTKNPLAINYTQWIIFTKYSLKQIKWVGYERAYKKNMHVQEHIDDKWDVVHIQLNRLIEDTGEVIKL